MHPKLTNLFQANFGIISSYQHNLTEEENQSQQTLLKSKILDLGLGIIELQAHTPHLEILSYFLSKCDLGKLKFLSRSFDQLCFIHHENNTTFFYKQEEPHLLNDSIDQILQHYFNEVTGGNHIHQFEIYAKEPNSLFTAMAISKGLRPPLQLHKLHR